MKLLEIVHTPDRNQAAFVFNDTWLIEEVEGKVPAQAFFTITDLNKNPIAELSSEAGNGVTVNPDVLTVSVTIQNSQVAVAEDTDGYWELQILYASGILETFQRGRAFIKKAL